MKPSLGLAGSTVEAQLHRVWCDVAAGKLLLHEITPSLLGFYSLGHDHGAASRQAEVDQANRDADRHYLAAHNPKDRASMLLERMDAALDRLPDDVLAMDVAGVHAQLAAVLPPRRQKKAA